MKINQVITEKSVSKQQQKFMGMVYAAKKGEKPASPDVAKAAKGMSKADARDFAKTKHKGLPNKVGEASGDKLGQVTSVSPSGDVTIKTPTGTEIKTKQDALLPGAQTGTVQMKPDAAGDALKPGTQVVSTENMDDGITSIKAADIQKELAASPDIPDEAKAEVQKLLVAKPDGSLDMHRTLGNMAGAMFYGMDELLEWLIDFSKECQQEINSPEFAQHPPEVQKAFKEIAAYTPTLEKQRQELTASAGEFDKESNKLHQKQFGNAMPEDQSPDNVQSPIGGNQDHDEISKLLVQRLRKLAGL